MSTNDICSLLKNNEYERVSCQLRKCTIQFDSQSNLKPIIISSDTFVGCFHQKVYVIKYVEYKHKRKSPRRKWFRDGRYS